MDKRADLRKHFENEAGQEQSNKMHSEKLAQLSSIEETIANAFGSLLNFMENKISKVELTNQLREISTPDVENVVAELKKLGETVNSAKTDQKPVIDALNALKREITLIPAKMPVPKDQKDTIKVSNLSEVKLDTSKIEKLIKGLELKVEAPIINIDKPDSYKSELKDILKAIQGIVIPEVKIPEQIPTDTSKIEKKLDESNKHLKIISEKKFGGAGGGGNGTPYTDSSGTAKNVILTVDGKIPVDAAFDTSLLATSAKQLPDNHQVTVSNQIDISALGKDATLTNGTQKIQIVDAGGDAVTVTGGKLDVNSSAPVGGATEAKQDTQITQLINLLTELKQKTEPDDIQNIEIMNAIRVLLQQTAMPPWYDPTTATLRVGSLAVTLSSTNVTTVTNLTNFGTSPADVMARDISINTWANNCRTTIT